ncbi:hypothetical protein FHL15_002637 [Xylaria flabelliformis]|uniref:Protein kinase domain-containing protein n=1 Tax=Xylaria flabelliformis TaxID=2512241 RepID=A0A553I842_9PEZI|nr:hypothetical protein FHL15_002637 [Xylaria flabelliformis]
MEFDKNRDPLESAKVIEVLTRGELDDDATVSVRFNGRRFNIQLSPNFFQNSPETTTLYLKYLQAIHPIGPGEFEGIRDTDVCKWIIDLFKNLFVQLAPEPLPSFDPEKIRSGEAKPLLSEYLFPETFGCRLEAVNEMSIPRHVDSCGGLMTPRTYLDDDLLDAMEDWTCFVDPSEIEVDFQNPEDALDQIPRRVRVDLDGSGHMTTCFFKGFETGVGDCPMSEEIKAYGKIHNANFGPDVRVGRLYGVAHDESSDTTLGLLLAYIDHRTTLVYAVKDDTPLAMKQKWARQIEDTLNELHRVGVIWGDAKAGNVIIDNENNVVITDFEGGYTNGWVDAEKAGTVEGDLQGLQNIMAFLFQHNPDDT